MEVEDFVGITTGALVGGSALDVAASLLLGWDASWMVFATGSVVGAAVGYRYAEHIWNWRSFWWRW